jgi:hypothetical protein
MTGTLEAEASLPVAWLDARDELEEESTSGVGDLLTRVVWSRASGPWSYAVSAGMYWPVGEMGNEDLPASATFSTGSVDPALGAFLSGPPFRGFSWFTSVSTRQVLDKRNNGSRLGSSYTATLGLNRQLAKRFSGQVLVSYFARERDEGNMMEDTGGDWLFVQPFLRADVYARPSYAVQVLLGVRVPLIQDVEGTQLVESPSLSLGFAHTVSF